MPRYSLAGLLLFTLGVAGGLTAAMAVKQTDLSLFGINTTGFTIIDRISASFACALAIWVVAGLAYQIVDLGRFLKSQSIPLNGQKAALQFDFVWRSAVALLLPATYLLQSIGDKWQSPETEFSTLGILLSPSHVSDLRWLLLLIAIGASRRFRRVDNAVSPTTWRRIVNLMTLLAGVLVAALILIDSGLVPALVFIAINGVEASHRLAWQRAPVGLELMHVETTFLIVSQVQMISALTAAATAGIWATGARGNRTNRASFFYVLAAFLASLAIVAEVWIRISVWPRLSPSFVEALPLVPQLVNLLIFAVAVVYVAARVSCLPANTTSVSWRVHPDAYLHERRIVLAVAFLLSAIQIARGVLEAVAYSGWNLFGQSSWIDLLFGSLIMPSYYWPWAMALLSVMKFREAGRATAESYIVADFSWLRFAAAVCLFGLVATSLAYAVCTWRIAIWLPMGW